MHSRTYKIEGMTCGGCVASVKNQLLTASEIKEAHVQLDFPQAQLNLNEPIALEFLQALVKKAGDYSISETPSVQEKTIDQLPNKSTST
ncbi:heavy-metal-associated domain-containing protein [Acidiluteibacter ferrifornacis]|uniref:heavy-metal-associated domain-containing protein n=1 Tax=Acidiluteibacter ferrifornacis TaxID=2692424 RepID=UPI001F1C5E65|nr:heavy metal-associated domain-containing protein [Acidiluteibacter ferrifornacis]